MGGGGGRSSSATASCSRPRPTTATLPSSRRGWSSECGGGRSGLGHDRAEERRSGCVIPLLASTHHITHHCCLPAAPPCRPSLPPAPPSRLLPLMIGWFALNVPSGLSLYYFANTVFTTGQQIYLKKLGGACGWRRGGCRGGRGGGGGGGPWVLLRGTTARGGVERSGPGSGCVPYLFACAGRSCSSSTPALALAPAASNNTTNRCQPAVV